MHGPKALIFDGSWNCVQVWEACGRDLVSAPLIIMMLHLSIGDAWNHCNNVDQNLGMAVPGVFLGCLGSGIFVTSAYYQVRGTCKDGTCRLSSR